MVTLIKKRNWIIKGRACAEGSKHKKYLKKYEYVASLTVALESLITTLALDARENRDITVFDLPGAFLQP